MAYITNYTLGKLVRTIDIKIDIDFDNFLKDVYPDEKIFFILNSRERKYLFKFKSILKDEEKFRLSYYKEVPLREDTGTFVSEQIGKTIYHLDKICETLNSEFLNFYIPKEIREIGAEAIRDYREWFIRNNYAKKYEQNEEILSAIIANYNILFPKKYNIPILPDGTALVRRLPNSSRASLDVAFDKESMLKRLGELKEGYNTIFSCPVLRKLSKFSGLRLQSEEEIKLKLNEIFEPGFVKNYGIKNVLNKLDWSHKIKTEIIQLILDYYKWTYDLPGKAFNHLTLDHFGLRCCNKCKKTETIQHSTD